MKVFTVNEALQRAIEEGGKVAIPAIVGLVATAGEFKPSPFGDGKPSQWASFTDGGDTKLNVENRKERLDLTKLQGRVLVFAKPVEEPKNPPVRVENASKKDGTPYPKLILNAFTEVYEVTAEGVVPVMVDSDNSGNLPLPNDVPKSRVVGFPQAQGQRVGGSGTAAATAMAPVASSPAPFRQAYTPPVALTEQELAERDQKNFARISALFTQAHAFAQTLYTDDVAVQQAASTLAGSTFIESNKR